MDTRNEKQSAEPDQGPTKPKEYGETDSKRLGEEPARPASEERPDLDWTDHED